MASKASWLGALSRLQLRALYRAYRGQRVPVLTKLPPLPARSWRRPELRVDQQQHRVEFAFRVPGAEAESTRVYWDEEHRTLTVHAFATSAESPCGRAEHAVSASEPWHAVVAVGGDVDGNRAEAFLADDVLRIFAPRVDSKPLTGLPLLAWVEGCSSGSLAAAT